MSDKYPLPAYLTEVQAGRCVDALCPNLDFNIGQFGLCQLRVAFERKRIQADLGSAPENCPDQAILAARVAPTT